MALAKVLFPIFRGISMYAVLYCLDPVAVFLSKSGLIISFTCHESGMNGRSAITPLTCVKKEEKNKRTSDDVLAIFTQAALMLPDQ